MNTSSQYPANNPQQQVVASPFVQIKERLLNDETVSSIAECYGVTPAKARIAIRNALAVIAASDDEQRLRESTPASLITAMMTSAQLGIYVDQRQHGWFIARFNKAKQQYEANFQIGYKGYIYKLREKLDNVDVQVYIVEKAEDFSFKTVDGYASVTYEPSNPFFDEYAKAAGAFCHITYTVGGIPKSVVEVLPQSEIKKIRAAAKTQKFWNQWAGEKIKVAAIRRACKHRFAAIVEDLDAVDNEDYDLGGAAQAGQGDKPSLMEKLKEETTQPDEPLEVEPDSEPSTVSEAEFEDVVPEPHEEEPASTPASSEAVQDSNDELPGEEVSPGDPSEPEEWDGQTIETGNEPIKKEWGGWLQAYNFLLTGITSVSDVAERKRILGLNKPFTDYLLESDRIEEVEALTSLTEQ